MAQTYIWTTKYEHLHKKQDSHRAYIFKKRNNSPYWEIYAPNVNLINKPFNRHGWNRTKNINNSQTARLFQNYNDMGFDPRHIYIMAKNILKIRMAQQKNGKERLRLRHEPVLRTWQKIRNIARSKFTNNIVKKPYNRLNFPFNSNIISRLKTNYIPNYGKSGQPLPHYGRGFQFYNSSNVKHNNFEPPRRPTPPRRRTPRRAQPSPHSVGTSGPRRR